MTANHLEQLLFAYETATETPDVSGAEHLDMLLVRSELARHQVTLTRSQANRLAAADHRLMAQANSFYQAIARIANLAQWRQAENAPPEHWWWYLDNLQPTPSYRLVEQPPFVTT